MRSAPTRSAHTRNCPMAAARNVSPDASRTGCPSSRSWWAIFPIVVVFPTPFTPTTRTTNGYGGATDIGTILGASVAAIIRLNSLRRAPMSGNSPRRHIARRVTTYSLARSAPASDRMSASSSSVRTCSSTGPIPRAIASTFIRRSSRVFDNPVLSRERKDPAGLSSCEGMRTRLKRGASGLEFHRNHLGDARFFHGDPVQYVGELHRPLVVRDEEELVIGRHLPDDRVEPVDVGVVQGSIRLVEQAERGGFDKEDREDEADGGQRLLPAGEKVQGLELLARRLRHDLHARFQEVPLVEQLQGSPSPQEQLGENLLKLPVDAVERRGEPVPRGPVDPLNGLGEVLEGFLEVLFLRQEEGVPFGKLLVLLEGGKVHLADGGHARPHLAGPGFPAGQIAVLFHPGPFPAGDLRGVDLVPLVDRAAQVLPVHLHALGRKTQVRKTGDFGALALTPLLQGFLPRREPRREFRVPLEVPFDFLLPRRQVDG